MCLNLKYIILILLQVFYFCKNDVDMPIANFRIFRGKTVEANHYPYQAALYVAKVDANIGFCGGSLITRKFVLTAAHCLYETVSAKVMLGSNERVKRDSNRVTLTSSVFLIHKYFSTTSGANDIGLVQLPTKVQLNSHIQTVKLPRKSAVNHTFVGTIAKLSGWGATSDQMDEPNDRLKDLHVRILSKAACPQFEVRTSNICGIGTDGGSACIGDSGGPLVIKLNDMSVIQIGIVSYGAQSGCANGLPHIYTRVSSYLEWIEANSDL